MYRRQRAGLRLYARSGFEPTGAARTTTALTGLSLDEVQYRKHLGMSGEWPGA